MKKIVIRSYDGKKKSFYFDLENISVIMKYMLSGDEVLEVFYKDGTTMWFDSCGDNYRVTSYFDDSKLLYSSDINNL